MNEVDVDKKLQDALTGDRWRMKQNGDPNIGGYLWDKWDTSGTYLKLLHIDYGDMQAALRQDFKLLREDQITNHTAATITKGFNFSKTTQDTFQWHVTAGLKIGAGAKAKVGLPLVGEGEATASVEVSVQGGTQTTHTDSVTWTDTVTIQVPPHTDVVAKARLLEGTVSDLPFKATMRAYGKVLVHIKTGTDQWRWNGGDIDDEKWFFSLQSPVRKPPFADEDRDFVVEGLFSGRVGFHVDVAAEPLPSSNSAEAVQVLR